MKIAVLVVTVGVGAALLQTAGHSDKPQPSMKMKRGTDPKIQPRNVNATSTFTMFDYNETQAVTSGMMPRAGCYCEPGEGPAYQNDMQVSPQSGITAHVGQPVQLRFDASIICHRQGIWDMSGKVHKNVDQLGDLNLGTIQWEIGSVWELPLEWGIVTYSGYTQVGTEEVTFFIELQCHDDFKNCTHTCIKKKTVTVNVVP